MKKLPIQLISNVEKDLFDRLLLAWPGGSYIFSAVVDPLLALTDILDSLYQKS